MFFFKRKSPDPDDAASHNGSETRSSAWDNFPRELLAGSTGIRGDVSPETALRSPVALAAIRAISETVGMLPVAIRIDTGSGWQKDRKHPSSRVLNLFANPWTPATDLRTQLTMDALLHGQGVARVIRVNGEIRELQRLLPTAVSVEYPDVYSDEPSYRVSTKNGQIMLSWRDVLHITTPGSARNRPMRLIDLAGDAISLDIIMARHQAKIFRSGGLPRVMISPDGEAMSKGPETLKNALALMKEQLQNGSFDPIMLPAAFKETATTFGLAEMQFLDLRRLVIEDVARALRVPATIVGDLTKGTFSNTEQLSRQFLQLCLLPWLETWEGAITRALIAPEERDRVEAEFVVRDLLRADFQAQSAAYRQATGGAYMTPNEARDLEGLPPVPEGDSLIMQAGQTGGNNQKDLNANP